MKKKVLGIIFGLLLIGATVPLISSAFENQQTFPAQEQIMEKECGCESDERFTSLITFDETTPFSPKPSIARNLPPSFSWTDVDGVDWTTSVKDQGSCGSCWDFAAIGALESIIQIREGCADLNLDLSEQYVLSCLHAAGSCNGGWAYNAYRYMKANTSQGNYCNGIIPEFCFPYEVNDDVPCGNVSSDWMDFLMPLDTYGRWVPDGSAEDRDAMKTQIMESGPIVTSMLFTIWNHGPDNLEEWGYTHHDPTEYYPYPGPMQGTNHQVVLVGWKDDPSITNGGYWIVKNSLSEEWGYNGFFNLEYGSLNIDKADINWVEYNPENYSNWMPVARIIGPSQGQIDQELAFDASSSIDHEGSIASYEWTFGDGTTGQGISATHTYTQQGIYPLTLTVIDNASNIDSDTRWIYIDTVNHAPETPTLLGPAVGKNGTGYNFTFWATDPDDDDVSYYLNWGDDYWFGGAVGWIGPFTSGEKVTLEKTWKKKGNYTVRVKACDQYGEKSDWAIHHLTITDQLIDINVNGGFGVSATILNNGTVGLTNLTWSIALDGKLIFIGASKTGTIDSLLVGESVTVRDFVIGFGKTGIRVSVESFSKNATASAFLFFVRKLS